MKKKSFIKDMFKENPVISLIFVAGVGTLAFFALRKLFLPSDKIIIKPQPLPDGGGGLPIGWSPLPLVMELQDAIKGSAIWEFGTYDKNSVYAKLLPLSNDQLTSVYNTWNKTYSNIEGCTLTQRLRDESNKPELSDTVLYKLTSLNLS